MNGEIIYYFDDMDSDLKFFDLNLIIGVIRIWDFFDYEMREFYIFDVFVRD